MPALDRASSDAPSTAPTTPRLLTRFWGRSRALDGGARAGRCIAHWRLARAHCATSSEKCFQRGNPVANDARPYSFKFGSATGASPFFQGRLADPEILGRFLRGKSPAIAARLAASQSGK